MNTTARLHKVVALILAGFVFSTLAAMANAGAPRGINLLVQWKGEGVAVVPPPEIADLLPATPIGCFQVPMVEPATGWEIGSGYDCVIELGFDPASGSGGPVRTAYVLSFRGRGAIATDSHIVVQPNTYDPDSKIDLGDGNVFPVTHLIADLPVSPEQNIYRGSRGFAKAGGRVRVSGGNNLERLGTGVIVFDYLFVVDFE